MSRLLKWRGNVLAYHRTNALLSGRGEVAYSALCRDGLRAYVTRSRGVTFDSRASAPALPRFERAQLSQIAIPLAGQYVVHRSREIELAGNEFLGESNFPWDERWSGDEFAVLVVEWDAAHGDVLRGSSLGKLTVTDRARMAAIAHALESDLRDGRGWGARASSTMTSLFALLHSLGAPRIDATALGEGILDSDRELVATLARLESNLAGQPMWCDLEAELTTSSRHLRRRRATVLAALARPTQQDFRTWMKHLRLRTAASFLTARGRTLEEVARAVGYGSARALLLAMHQAGLPSPSALRSLARGE